MTADPALKARLTTLWDSWTAVADADGGDFYGQQKVAVEAWLTSGEVFVRLRTRQAADGLPVPLQVQLLEADMVPLLDTSVWPGLPAGHTIYQGIELNGIGQRVAYWVYKRHPGDNPPAVSVQELTRIPAASMAHLFDPQRPGQMRGIPVLAPILVHLAQRDGLR